MNNLFKCVMLLAAAGLIFSTARADEWNKRTVVTINQPIEIPNQVLEPGTYVFKLADSQSNRDIVQVYDKDQKHLIATILAIPNYRLHLTGKTEMTFWERTAGTPSALRAWFYPGDNFGQEFAYPPAQAARIAAYAHEPVVTTTANTSEYPKAQVTQTPPPPAAQAPAQAAAPAPPPPPQQTEPAPAPAPREEAATPPPPPAQTEPPQQTAPPQPPTELPHTGSSAPLFGLIGLVGLIGGVATFLAPVRSR